MITTQKSALVRRTLVLGIVAMLVAAIPGAALAKPLDTGAPRVRIVAAGADASFDGDLGEFNVAAGNGRGGTVLAGSLVTVYQTSGTPTAIDCTGRGQATTDLATGTVVIQSAGRGRTVCTFTN